MNDEYIEEFEDLFASRLYLDKVGRSLSDEELSELINYIKDPIGVGIWILNIDWDENGISNLRIKEDIIEKIDKNGKLNSLFDDEEPELIVDDVIVDDELKNSIIDIVNDQTKRISFYFSLFYCIIESEKTEFKKVFQKIHPQNRLIFNNIDLVKIKNQYNEAYNIFFNRIYGQHFSPRVTYDKIFRFKDGNFCVISTVLSNRKAYKIKLYGLQYDYLQTIKDFLTSIGVIKEAHIEKYFSPSEIVFDPYMTFFKNCCQDIFSYQPYIKSVDKAISEFEEQNYSNSIHSIGILSEHILIEIYESLLRKECDSTLTLGQIYSKIKSEIREITKENDEETIDFSLLFDKVNIMIEECKNNPDNYSQGDTLEFIRLLIQSMKDNERNMKQHIKNKIDPVDNDSIFPKTIQKNINELLYYRNAVSHKSRVPIWKFEATKSLYCCLTLYIWWIETKKSVEWYLTKEETIKQIAFNN